MEYYVPSDDYGGGKIASVRDGKRCLYCSSITIESEITSFSFSDAIGVPDPHDGSSVFNANEVRQNFVN